MSLFENVHGVNLPAALDCSLLTYDDLTNQPTNCVWLANPERFSVCEM